MEEGSSPSDDARHAMTSIETGLDLILEMRIDAKLDMILGKLEALLGSDPVNPYLKEDSSPSDDARNAMIDIEAKLDMILKMDIEGKLDMILARVDMMEDERLDEKEELEERRGRGRDREGMESDERRRPMSEQKLREAVRKALKASVKKA